MPPEPKKTIEELLEASAKMRRAEFGRDPEMPNPMRAQLHDEMARLARDDAPKRSSSWFGIGWPRLALGAAMATLLVGASLLWVGRTHRTADMELIATRDRLATNQPAPPEPALSKGFNTGTSAAPASGNFADTSGNETKLMETAKANADDSNAVKKFAEVTIPPAATDEKINAGLAAKEAQSSAAAAKTAQEPVTPAAAAPSLAQNRENIRQQFSQNAGNQLFRNAKTKQMPDVLNTFQVEQDGAQIRVVDADGSTYTGNIEPRGQNTASSRAKAARSYAVPSAKRGAKAEETESANNEFSFRATGHNVSLKRSVVFEGNYVAPRSPQQSASDATTAKRAEPPPARIFGTAKVHGESPVSVDAVSVSQ